MSKDKGPQIHSKVSTNIGALGREMRRQGVVSEAKTSNVVERPVIDPQYSDVEEEVIDTSVEVVDSEVQVEAQPEVINEGDVVTPYGEDDDFEEDSDVEELESDEDSLEDFDAEEVDVEEDYEEDFAEGSALVERLRSFDLDLMDVNVTPRITFLTNLTDDSVNARLLQNKTINKDYDGQEYKTSLYQPLARPKKTTKGKTAWNRGILRTPIESLIEVTSEFSNDIRLYSTPEQIAGFLESRIESMVSEINNSIYSTFNTVDDAGIQDVGEVLADGVILARDLIRVTPYVTFATDDVSGSIQMYVNLVTSLRIPCILDSDSDKWEQLTGNHIKTFRTLCNAFDIETDILFLFNSESFADPARIQAFSTIAESFGGEGTEVFNFRNLDEREVLGDQAYLSDDIAEHHLFGENGDIILALPLVYKEEGQPEE